jgi:transcriptional regulator with XRE-family HTH domain
MEWKPDEIKTLRQALGLTQAEFAKKFSLSQSLVAYWETGKRSPGPLFKAKLKRLASDGIHRNSSENSEGEQNVTSDSNSKNSLKIIFIKDIIFMQSCNKRNEAILMLTKLTKQREMRDVEEKASYTFRLPIELHLKAKGVANRLNVSIAYLYQKAIENYVEKIGQEITESKL